MAIKNAAAVMILAALLVPVEASAQRRGDNDRAPRGGADSRQFITVYRDADFRGERMTFQDAVRDLQPLRFNDVISSMEMRGAWEVCVDSRFRGRCEVFEGRVRDLKDLGLNDRISSIRPARASRR